SSLENHNWPHFDRAAFRPWNISRDLGCFINIVRLDQIVPAELFLGLGKRPVGDHRFGVPDAHRLGGGCGLKGVASLNRVGELFTEHSESLSFRTLLLGAQGGPTLLLAVNQQQKFHSVVSFIASTPDRREIDRSNGIYLGIVARAARQSSLNTAVRPR